MDEYKKNTLPSRKKKLIDTSMQYYNQKIAQQEIVLSEIKRQLKNMVFYRLLAFLGVVLPWFLGDLPLKYQLGLSVLFLILFFVLVKRNVKINAKKKFVETQLKLLENEKLCLDKNYQNNPTGEEFKESDHAYIFDLDIFGEGSLYQYITRAATLIGKQRLASWLSKPELDVRELKQRQNAVEELHALPDLRIEVQTNGLLSNEQPGDVQRVIDWVKGASHFKLKKHYRFLLTLIPVFAVVLTLLFYFGLIAGQVFSFLIALPLIIAAKHFKNTQETYKKLDQGFKAVAKFHSVFHEIEKQQFKSQKLREIQANAAGAHQALKELNQVISAFDQRLNLLVAIFMNMVLAWDLRCMVGLATWQEKHQGNTANWFEALAQFEALSSFATFQFNHQEETEFPTFNTSGSMEGKQLGHPFLQRENRVDNDFSIQDNSFAIITGANMAGKSTFLRTLGISIVLANAGSSIIAKSFDLQPIQIYSSMRTSDSLQKNESYFYTELLRLYHLVNRLAKGEKLFIILDEILKGTNSKDKAEGSYKFIRKILQLDAMGVIATHDLSLCEIEKEFPDHVTNLFFDVTIQGDDLSFDYKLRKGICSNMNATFLMKKMGITD